MIQVPYGPPRTTVELKQPAGDGAPIAGKEIVVPDGTEFSVMTV